MASPDTEEEYVRDWMPFDGKEYVAAGTNITYYRGTVSFDGTAPGNPCPAAAAVQHSLLQCGTALCPVPKLTVDPLLPRVQPPPARPQLLRADQGLERGRPPPPGSGEIRKNSSFA